MPNWTRKDLEKQYEVAKKNGWLPVIAQSSGLYGFKTELLMAIASRETNLNPKYLSISGDGGHGYGLMQIDKRSFPEWVSTGKWRDAGECFLKGVQVLISKLTAIKKARGNDLTITDSKGNITTFRVCDFDDNTALRIAVSAYNVGLWALYHYCKSGNPDKTTTGRDYGSDVFARAAVFKDIIYKS